MKSKKVIIICIIVILALIIGAGIYFITKNNNNLDSSNSNGIMSSNSKISWERSESIVTDNNYVVEEGVINTKNVSTKSLTNITLEEFVNKWTENTETNFLCYYNLENKLSKFLTADNIRKGENFSSDTNFYIKGVLPRI